MTAIRLPVSFVLSLCTTATLFWFLGLLIAVDPAKLVPIIGPIQITPKLVPELEPVVIHEPIRPIEKPNPPPDVPDVQIDPFPELLRGDPKELAPLEWRGHGEGPLQHRDPDTAMKESGSNRPPIPQVRMEPQYPDGAKNSGIEGWITFRFTVAADGSVKDIEIVDAEPQRVWDSATIRAVSGWKYQPAIRDGKPVEQRGVTVTYRFELDRCPIQR
jgi:protein TonB